MTAAATIITLSTESDLMWALTSYINSDAEAPILNSADYAVIGDLTEIVPAITAELRKSRAS